MNYFPFKLSGTEVFVLPEFSLNSIDEEAFISLHKLNVHIHLKKITYKPYPIVYIPIFPSLKHISYITYFIILFFSYLI